MDRAPASSARSRAASGAAVKAMAAAKRRRWLRMALCSCENGVAHADAYPLPYAAASPIGKTGAAGAVWPDLDPARSKRTAEMPPIEDEVGRGRRAVGGGQHRAHAG